MNVNIFFCARHQATHCMLSLFSSIRLSLPEVLVCQIWGFFSKIAGLGGRFYFKEFAENVLFSTT